MKQLQICRGPSFYVGCMRDTLLCDSSLSSLCLSSSTLPLLVLLDTLGRVVEISIVLIYHSQPHTTTLICAIRLTHANLSTFQTILIIYYYDYEIYDFFSAKSYVVAIKTNKQRQVFNDLVLDLNPR